jgi:lipopolysaccharide-binding protein
VSATNPGFRVVLTQKALDYVVGVGIPLLEEQLGDLTIPTITETYDAGIFTVTFTLSNAIFTGINFGDPYLTSDEEGLVLTDDGVSISMHADWAWKDQDWPYLSDSGSADASAEGINLSVAVDITRNMSSGGFHLNTSFCSIEIDNLNIDFHGGASWLYNLFSSIIEGKLKDYLNSELCSELAHEINTAGNLLADSVTGIYLKCTPYGV